MRKPMLVVVTLLGALLVSACSGTVAADTRSSTSMSTSPVATTPLSGTASPTPTQSQQPVATPTSQDHAEAPSGISPGQLTVDKSQCEPILDDSNVKTANELSVLVNMTPVQYDLAVKRVQQKYPDIPGIQGSLTDTDQLRLACSAAIEIVKLYQANRADLKLPLVESVSYGIVIKK